MYEAIQAHARYAARVTPAPAEPGAMRAARIVTLRARRARGASGRGR
jgi:hypothetical protein